MTVEIILDVVPVIESTFGVVEITNGISEVESRVGVPVRVDVPIIVGVEKAETSDVGMSTNKSYKQCSNYYVQFITT